MPTELSVFYLFATTAATGVAAALLFIPVAVLGRRFFVLLSLVALVLLALALLSAGLTTGYAFLVAAAALVFYNVTLPSQPRVDPTTRPSTEGAESKRARGNSALAAQAALALAVGAGGVGIVLEAFTIAENLEPASLPASFLTVALLGSALQVGSAIVAMTLGHWYLVTRGLSFRPLRRLTWLLGGAVALRLVLTSLGVWIQEERWSNMIGEAGWTSFFLADGIFVASSWLFGILVPLVLVRLVLGCLDVESNQSATGILYVIVAFVLLGDLLAKHYLLSAGLAI